MVAIQVNNQQWTPYQLQAGVNASFFALGQQVVYVSESQTPTDDYMPFSEINITPQAPTTLYFKTQYGSAIVIFATNISTSGGGGGGGGTPPVPTYSFQAPLVNNGGNISIALSQALQVTSGNLDLNLLQDQNFRDALQDISEALRIADYTSVGRVMPQPSHFDLNALNGELRLDLTSGGVLNVNFATKQEYNNLASVVQTLLSGVDIIGKIPNDNTQVTANTQLLTDFVQAEKSRAPRGGDIVLTTEQPNTSPSFVWIYTSTNTWDNIGTTGAGIATQNTIGLIKGSNTLQIALDGTANVQGVVFDSGDQQVNGNKNFNGITQFATKVRMGYGGSTVLLTPEDDSAKTLRFRDTSVGTNNQFNLDLENVCGLTGIKDPTSARDAVPRDWANNQYIPKVTTTATNGIQVTSNAQKVFNFDYVWDDSQAAYRNWSGIKLRSKTQSAAAFTDMFYLEYRNEDNLGIFMTCIGNKLNFANPTKVKGVSCEDADSDDTATNKGWVENKLTSYLKGDIIPVGGSLPAQTASDTIYYTEV